MSISDLEAEDVVLLSSLVVSAMAVVIDEIYSSTPFKALKIVGLILSIGLVIHRIRTGKPFYKDITEKEWVKFGDFFQITVLKSEHKRGKFPHSRCLVPNGQGGYGECLVDPDVQPNGNIIIRVSQPAFIRLEVRK